MNYLTTTSAIMKKKEFAATTSPIPDIAWFKLNGDILDYRGDGVGKTGATTVNPEQYYPYLSKSSYLCTGGAHYTSNYIALPTIIRPATVTFSCWVNVTTVITLSRIFDYGGKFRLTMKSSNLNLFFNDTLQVAYSTTFQNVWKHILFTVNGTTLIFYENGLPRTTTTIVALTTLTSNGYLFASFGGDPDTAGKCSDFRIYGRVLTASEIMGLYNKI